MISAPHLVKLHLHRGSDGLGLFDGFGDGRINFCDRVHDCLVIVDVAKNSNAVGTPMQWTFDGLLRAVICLFRALLGPFLARIELVTDA